MDRGTRLGGDDDVADLLAVGSTAAAEDEVDAAGLLHLAAADVEVVRLDRLRHLVERQVVLDEPAQSSLP